MGGKSVAGVLLMMLSPIFGGCSKPKSIPPGPQSSFGVVQEDFHCTYLRWDEGLAIMLVDRLNNHTGQGSSSTEDALHLHRGSSTGEDGSSYDWDLATKDGRTASIRIDGTPYDLAKGTVFAVEVADEEVIVHQIDKDLSKIGSGIEKCSEFIRSNPDILERIAPEPDLQIESKN